MWWLRRLWWLLTGKKGDEEFRDITDLADHQRALSIRHEEFRWNDNLEEWLALRRDYGAICRPAKFHEIYWHRSEEDREEQRRVNAGELDTPHFIVRCDDIGYWGVFKRHGEWAGRDVNQLRPISQLFRLYRQYEYDNLMQFVMKAAFGKNWQDDPVCQRDLRKVDKELGLERGPGRR